MVCKRDMAHSAYYNLSQADCLYTIPDTDERPLTLDIYMKNEGTYTEEAWSCLRKYISTRYHTDWHNDRFNTPPETKFSEVSPEECKRWNHTLQCLINREVWEMSRHGDSLSTDRKLNTNYVPWYNFWTGEQTEKKENCVISKI